MVKSKINELEVVKLLIKEKGLVPSPPGIWLNKVEYHFLSYLQEKTMTIYLKSKNGGAAII